MTPTPARAAASVLSDAELSDALGLWHRLRDDDGTLVETVARALWPADHWNDPAPWPEGDDLISRGSRARFRHLADHAIAAVRGEVR